MIEEFSLEDFGKRHYDTRILHIAEFAIYAFLNDFMNFSGEDEIDLNEISDKIPYLYLEYTILCA